MLIRVLSFLLESLFFILIAAALLRAWMNWTRVNMRGQPGAFVMAITDWLVKPVRLSLPKKLAQSKIDSASLLVALLFAIAYALIWWVVFRFVLGESDMATLEPAVVFSLLSFALKMLLRVTLQTLMVMVIGFAILSWVQPGSPAYALLSRLTEPLLAPLRRIIPSLGGIDLSAIALIILLQVGLILLA